MLGDTIRATEVGGGMGGIGMSNAVLAAHCGGSGVAGKAMPGRGQGAPGTSHGRPAVLRCGAGEVGGIGIRSRLVSTSPAEPIVPDGSDAAARGGNEPACPAASAPVLGVMPSCHKRSKATCPLARSWSRYTELEVACSRVGRPHGSGPRVGAVLTLAATASAACSVELDSAACPSATSVSAATLLRGTGDLRLRAGDGTPKSARGVAAGGTSLLPSTGSAALQDSGASAGAAPPDAASAALVALAAPLR
mmetsp:Transcript_8202/g.17928  ORF Transcript_8202/g.17928 Transcript_8202/m.17928 type:complete len:250 (+) Transcript_8202:251-1000(+)